MMYLFKIHVHASIKYVYIYQFCFEEMIVNDQFPFALLLSSSFYCLPSQTLNNKNEPINLLGT